MSGHFVPSTAVALGFINFCKSARWGERQSVWLWRQLSPETQHNWLSECLLRPVCVYGQNDHPLPVCGVCNYFRIGNAGSRTVIDDDPALLLVTTAVAATQGAALGPEEEMRAFLEDTGAIRSPQMSRLLFTSCSFSLSLFFFFFLLSLRLAVATKQVSKCRGMISRVCWVWLCCVSMKPCVSLCMFKEICSTSLEMCHYVCHVIKKNKPKKPLNISQLNTIQTVICIL